MKLVQISKPNTKGQLVIPKAFRDELDINEDSFLKIFLHQNTINIVPLEETVLSTNTKANKSSSKKESDYLKVLAGTKGSWGTQTKKHEKPYQDKKRVDFRKLPGFGIWKDRNDMKNTNEWVDRLRDKQSERLKLHDTDY